jgi:serine/threonine-protein kinase
MDAERWRLLRQRFDQAADAEPDARAAMLAGWRQEDPALADEIERLLIAEDLVAPMAVASPAGATLKVLGEQAAPKAGAQVGPWRLDAEIGSGGMGRVYRATRDDGAYDQAVAIKLLRREALNPALLRRFSVERQVLARLDHPGIARLIDASTLDDGTPYVVMELVDGRPLLEWCDARRLPVDGRLRLFRRVLDAVAAAHRALVVHRDLKSSNILVTADGTPKLLDFGIAKPLATSPEVTATAERFFTPATAAPEQLRGEPVTVAVDVYALGLLLYELLCGKPAVEIAGLTAGQAERRILEDVPATMSARIGRADEALASARGLASTDALRRLLADDLDPIVERCLRKEPAARYASVEQLAADVDNALAGRPVSARAGRRWYRVRKFLVRNRYVVAAAASFAFVIASAMTVIIAQAIAIADERDRATLERDRARAVVGLLKRAFESADPSQTAGAEVSARDVLVAARPELDGLLDEQPELYADLAGTIAEVELSLGLANEAYELTSSTFGMISANADIGQVPDQLLLTAARAAIAASKPEEAVALLARLSGAAVMQPQAVALRGLIESERGNYDEAIVILRDAVQQQAELPPTEASARRTRLDLANVLRLSGRLEEALGVIDDTLRWQASLGASHPEVARTKLRRSSMLRRLGRSEEGLSDAREVLALYSRVYGANSAAAAVAHNTLGGLLNSLGRAELALPHMQAEYEILRESRGPAHRDTVRAAQNLAVVLDNAYGPSGGEQAEALFLDAIAEGARLYGNEHPSLVAFRSNYARFLLRRGREQEALAVLVAVGMENALAGTTPALREQVIARIREILDRSDCRFPSNRSMGLERERLTEELPLIRLAACVPRNGAAPAVARNSD